ncbi:MAG: DUF1674 domain-containing protein [Gammaproteobacteria bacterium]|nr:DUF1674 domain-containing protein [Gammaproteobacteria bacterium]
MSDTSSKKPTATPEPDAAGVQKWRPEQAADTPDQPKDVLPKEVGGREGPEPTRFGDWEKNGRCIDF